MGEKSLNNNMGSINKSVLDVFGDLAHGSDDKRNKSCVALVQRLAEKSAEDEDENGLSREQSYCLNRLVRGLGATNPALQKGSFSALVGVLHSFPHISFSILNEVIQRGLQVSTNASKVEGGETTLGQMLALGAAVRSGLFSRSSPDEQTHILSTLIACGKKKSYLPFAASSFILDLLENVEEKPFKNVLWPVLKELVARGWHDQTLDSLLILLTVHYRYPSIVKSKHVQQWLGCGLLSGESMKQFAPKLVNVNSALNLKHPIYDVFCSALCAPEHASLLESFWTVEINEQLVHTSRGKEQSALHILVLLLNNVKNKDCLVMLLSSQFLEIIGRILRGTQEEKNRFPDLHRVAQVAMTTLTKVLNSEDIKDKVRLKLLNKLLFASGNLEYEKQTGTNITILLENKLSMSGVKKLTKQFQDVVVGLPHDKPWANSNRIFAAQQFTRLVGHPTCTSEVDWKVDQLIFLLRCGMFREDSTIMSADLAAAIKKNFFRALDQKFSSSEELTNVLGKIVKHLDELLSNGNKSGLTLRSPISPEALSSWKKMVKLVSQFEKKTVSNNSKGSAEQIFHILFLHMGLQLLGDSKVAQEALQELHSCYERLQDRKNVEKHKGEPQWVEVTVDLFLSLLSQDVHLLRTVVSTVFPYLSKHLTVSSFCQILDVLDPDRNENPLSSSKDDEMMSDSESESDMSSDESDDDARPSKKKLVNGNHNDVSKDGSGDDESDNESDGDEMDDDDDLYEEDETINDKLRMEVRQALGNDACVTDTESIDLDDLDEEEGQRMNLALGRAFKTLRNSKSSKRKKQSKSDEAVTHFRLRVLDLIEVYISRDPAMALCLEAVAPLLSLLAFCSKDAHQKPLQTRVANILNKLTSLKKFSSIEGVNEEGIAEQVKALTDKGSRSAAVFLGIIDNISKCCILLVRCAEYLQSHTPDRQGSVPSPVAEVFKTLLVNLLVKRDSLLPCAMFESILRLQWDGCWSLAAALVQQLFDSNVRNFRRKQAVNLLSIFFNNNQLLSALSSERKKEFQCMVSSIVSQTVEILNNPDSTQGLNGSFLGEVLRLLPLLLNRDVKSKHKTALSAALTKFSKESQGVSQASKNTIVQISKKLNNCDVGSLKLVKNMKATVNGSGSKGNDSEDDERNGEEVTEEKQKKKAKKEGVELGQSSKENISRKQMKLQRMAMMAEGLEVGTFSSTVGDALNGADSDALEDDTDSSTSPKRSKLSTTNRSANATLTKRKSKNSLSEPRPPSDHAKKKKKV